MSNVVTLPVVTSLGIDPDRVLEEAIGRMDKVMVIGWDKEGQLYTTCSFSDGGEALWLMEKTRHRLMEYDGEE